MQRAWIGLPVLLCAFVVAGTVRRSSAAVIRTPSDISASSQLVLYEMRASPADLEIGGDLAGVPPGVTRYLTRDELLALPQVSYTVADDSNFAGAVKVSGVALDELSRRLGAAPSSEMVIAVCDDKYRAHYPRDYMAAHHPLLVLEVNGKPPAGWPKDPESGAAMGPYMISHPRFAPSFRILAHADAAQIPWGVLRLEFRDEHAVFGAIAPRGPHAEEPAVQAGFRIAQQNCFRCHNMGDEGGQKAGLPWTAVAAFAAGAPGTFAAYVRNPKAMNARTQMAGSPEYDDATIAALEAYFETFAPSAQGKR